MDKKNQQQDHLDYWQKRQEDIVSYLDRADLDIFNELSRVYSNQSLSLQKDLYDFYNRFKVKIYFILFNLLMLN